MDSQAFKLLTDKLEEVSKDVKLINKELGEVKEDLSKYKGFVGGITFVFSIVWAVGTYAISHLFNKNNV